MRSSDPNETPAVVYAARSAAEREEGAKSTDSQVETVLAAIQSAGNRTLIAEPFAEDGFSGSKRSRGPALQAAIDVAVAAADEHGRAELWAFHSSRFGRGSGRKGEARAIGALYYDLRRQGVALRTVEDDEFVSNEMLIGFASKQASKYADDLGAHVRRGYEAAARAGRPLFSIIPDGYMAAYDHDAAGRVTGRRLVKNPARAAIYELQFELALAGWSDTAIVVELDRKGYRTNPQKKTHAPRPFDANRVAQTLTNPTYAGLVVHRGEVVGPGNWEGYVTPEQFDALQAARAAKVGPRRPGRPPEGYLLSNIATCGVCGSSMHCLTGRKVRKDGTYPKRYVCRSHRERPQDGCDSKPIDAAMVDGAFAANLEIFLQDIDGWRERLSVDRRADVARMQDEVDRATDDLAAIERRIAGSRRRYDRALDDDDDDRAATIEDAMSAQRGDRERAQRRLQAAQTALADATAEPHADDPTGAFLDVLRGELSARTKDARDDLKRMNTVLADYFDSVGLQATSEGGVLVSPVLSRAAAERIYADVTNWGSGRIDVVMPGEPDFDPRQVAWSDADTPMPPDEEPFTAFARIRPVDPIVAKCLSTSQNTRVRPSQATRSSSP